MSSKIVPVDPTEEMRLAFGNQIRTGNYNEGTLVGDLCLGIWQAMIAAAPVVERQPDAWRYAVNGMWEWCADREYAVRELAEFRADHSAEELAELKADGLLDPQALYTAPPELAELQATIDRLTAENEQSSKHCEIVGNLLERTVAERDQFKAEIDQLKGGHGETVSDDELMALADKAFGQVVDYDLRGSPITDYRVLTMGAYGPAIRRLVTLARQHPASQPATVAVVMSFEYQHPLTKEKRTVTLTKAEIADGMEDGLYEKLVKQFCQCEPVGETNVIDCNCDEYIHDFDLIANDATPATDPLHQQLADVTHQRDLLAAAIGEAAVKAGIVRADADIPAPALLMLADDMADTIVNLNAVSAASQ